MIFDNIGTQMAFPRYEFVHDSQDVSTEWMIFHTFYIQKVFLQYEFFDVLQDLNKQ